MSSRLLAALLCQGSSNLIYTLRKACVHGRKFSRGMLWELKKRRDKKGKLINRLRERPSGNNGQPSGGEPQQLQNPKSQHPLTCTTMCMCTHVCAWTPFIFLFLSHTYCVFLFSDHMVWKGASQADVLLLAPQRTQVTDGRNKTGGQRRQTSSSSPALLISHKTVELGVWREDFMDEASVIVL